MTRLFAYARVSTTDQNNENQAQLISSAGYSVEPHRFFEEKISGSVSASERPVFQRLLNKIERGDTVIVTKLDRLGRDAIDIQNTIARFASLEVRLIVLQLGNLDITSSAGHLIVSILSSFAQFERELIVERTVAGQQRARAAGKRFGRPPMTTSTQRDAIRSAHQSGTSISQLARTHSVSRATIHSIVAS
jgi:putative DNA-invertase from lambdoid prophage Rac